MVVHKKLSILSVIKIVNVITPKIYLLKRMTTNFFVAFGQINHLSESLKL